MSDMKELAAILAQEWGPDLETGRGRDFETLERFASRLLTRGVRVGDSVQLPAPEYTEAAHMTDSRVEALLRALVGAWDERIAASQDYSAPEHERDDAGRDKAFRRLGDAASAWDAALIAARAALAGPLSLEQAAARGLACRCGGDSEGHDAAEHLAGRPLPEPASEILDLSRIKYDEDWNMLAAMDGPQLRLALRALAKAQANGDA